MPQSDIIAKANQLLNRRDAPNGPWFYLSRDWRRQLLFSVGYVSIPIAAWYLNFSALAIAVACFFVGTKVRDVRWWITLSKEWPTTSELLDWAKIENIANDVADP